MAKAGMFHNHLDFGLRSVCRELSRIYHSASLSRDSQCSRNNETVFFWKGSNFSTATVDLRSEIDWSRRFFLSKRRLPMRPNPGKS